MPDLKFSDQTAGLKLTAPEITEDAQFGLSNDLGGAGPSNAVTPLTELRKAIGAYGAGNVITVGEGGDYADMQSATTARKNITTFTFVASVTVSSLIGDLRTLKADTGTPFAGYEGDNVCVSVDGSVKCRASVLTNDTLQLEHDLAATVTSVNAYVSYYRYTCIFILPGNEIVSDSPIEMHPYTVITGDKYSSKLKVDPVSVGLSVPNIAAFQNSEAIFFAGIGWSLGPTLFTTEFYIQNISVTMPHGLGPSPITGNIFMNLASETGNRDYLAQITINNCDIYSGYNDGVFWSPLTELDTGGGLTITNTYWIGGWDIVRVRHIRSLIIKNCEFTVFGADPAVALAVNTISLGMRTNQSLPGSRAEYLIENSIIKAISTLGGENGTANTTAIQVLGRMNSNSSLIVKDCQLKVNVFGGTGDAVGFKVAGETVSGAETPYILSMHNTFDVTNGGTGAEFAMQSLVPTYNMLKLDCIALPNTVSAIDGTITDVTTI